MQKPNRTLLPKSPFFKGGLYLQFLIVPPFSQGGLGGNRMIPPSENTFGKRYNPLLLVPQGVPRTPDWGGGFEAVMANPQSGP